MTHSKMDPRVIRTRKSMMDAFIKLSEEKEFKDITVKDITTEAMINRATFYYHFEDIYDLLEKALSEVLLINLNYENFQSERLTEETIGAIFEAVTDFQQSLSYRCHRGYEETISRIIIEQLEVVFYKMLLAQKAAEEDEASRITAVMLSWGIYGASVEWKRQGKISPKEYIKAAVPYIRYGLEADAKIADNIIEKN